MPHFDYHRPETMDRALELLAELGEGALPVAGATDVWVNLRLKKIAPKALVSLRGLSELCGLKKIDGFLEIGAATPHAVLEDSPEVAALYPALHQAASAVGSRQVRNVGTIGGNLCNAAPSADTAVPLFLYDAVLVLRSASGERTVTPAEFFVSPGKTSLRTGEILTAIRLPDPEPGTFSGYIKHTRRKAMELPLLGVGVLVTLSPGGKTVQKARVALGVAGPVPMRAAKAEEALMGTGLTAETAVQAARLAAGEAKVRDSWRAKAWYRRRMIEVLMPRILSEAGAI